MNPYEQLTMKARKILNDLGPKGPRLNAAGKSLSVQPARRYLSLEDVKAGRVPKPTPKELAQRHEAIMKARDLRARLAISPLTTAAIIRELRDRPEMD